MTPKRDLSKVKGALRVPADFVTRRLSALPRREPGAATSSGSDAGETPKQRGARSSPLAAAASFFPKRPLTRNLWLFVWIVAVIAAAQITLYLNPLAGVYVNAGAFASLLGLALWQERARQLLIAVAIIPVAQLVGMSLPDGSIFQRTITVSVIILLLGLVYQYMFTLDYPRQGTTLRGAKYSYLLAIPFTLVAGQLIGLIGFGLMHGNYAFDGTPAVMVMSGVIIMAISEEILFRGLIQQRAYLFFNPITASVLAAALYTMLTIGHGGGVAAPIVGALIGAATSLAYYLKQNLLLTIAINMGAKLMFIGLLAAFVYN